MGYRVAVVGATGAVGREIIKILAERAFPVDDIAAIASGRSAGKDVSFGDKRVLKVQSLDKFDFKGWDIGLFSPGAAVSAIHGPARGRGRLPRHRQYQPVPHGAGRPPGGAGGEPGRAQPHPPRHHRQPELLDHPARRGAEAAARQVQDPPGRGRDLSIRVGRRQGRHGRALGAEPRHLRQRHADGAGIHQADRLQLHSAHRPLHG